VNLSKPILLGSICMSTDHKGIARRRARTKAREGQRTGRRPEGVLASTSNSARSQDRLGLPGQITKDREAPKQTTSKEVLVSANGKSRIKLQGEKGRRKNDIRSKKLYQLREKVT